MKLLLTSAGFTTSQIVEALQSLCGKPFNEMMIAVIPTAHNAEPGDKTWFLDETLLGPHALNWKQFNIVDLAAVESLDKSLWWPQLEDADVILIGGGNVFYLSYWLQKAGLYEAIPGWLSSKVFVGISAGSQIFGSDLYASSEAMELNGVFEDADYDQFGPTGQSSAKTLKLVDFTFRPHYNSPNLPKLNDEYLTELSKTLTYPIYAVDDNCAIVADTDVVDVIGSGQWKKFA